MYLIPWTSNLTPFRASIPDISLSFRFGFSPEKKGKSSKFENAVV